MHSFWAYRFGQSSCENPKRHCRLFAATSLLIILNFSSPQLSPLHDSHLWTRNLIWALVDYLALSGIVVVGKNARAPMVPRKKQLSECMKRSWYWGSTWWIRGTSEETRHFCSGLICCIRKMYGSVGKKAFQSFQKILSPLEPKSVDHTTTVRLILIIIF